MNKHQKMIITATTAYSWIYPEVKNWPQTTDDLINDVVKCLINDVVKTLTKSDSSPNFFFLPIISHLSLLNP